MLSKIPLRDRLTSVFCESSSRVISLRMDDFDGSENFFMAMDWLPLVSKNIKTVVKEKCRILHYQLEFLPTSSLILAAHPTMYLDVHSVDMIVVVRASLDTEKCLSKPWA